MMSLAERAATHEGRHTAMPLMPLLRYDHMATLPPILFLRDALFSALLRCRHAVDKLPRADAATLRRHDAFRHCHAAPCHTLP